MLRRVGFELFRGFRSVEVDLGAVTALVGRNSSGKTSVLHAIRMAAVALDIALNERGPVQVANDDWFVLAHDLLVLDTPKLYPAGRFRELFTPNHEGDSSLSIRLVFDHDAYVQEARVDIHQSQDELVRLTAQIKSEQGRLGQRKRASGSRAGRGGSPRSVPRGGIAGVARGGVPRNVGNDVRQASVETDGAIEEISSVPQDPGPWFKENVRRAIPMVSFIPPFYGVTGREEYRSSAALDRMQREGDQSHIVRNLVARLSGEAFERLNVFLKLAIGASIAKRTTAQDAERHEFLDVYFQDTNGDLELSSAGAGLVNLVALFAAIEYARATRGDGRELIVLLDEPEAHLHPQLQGNIGDALASIAADARAQLILATHSVEMINRIGRREGSTLIAIDRVTSTSTKLDSEAAIVRELGKWCDLTPFASLNFLAKRRILFHEGPSDGRILEACAKVFFRTRDYGRRIFESWTLASLEGVGNASAQGVLRAVLTPDVFPELELGEPVRAICVFDRDHDRTRMTGIQPIRGRHKDHFRAYEVVWSRHSIESLFLDKKCLFAWLSVPLVPTQITANDLEKLLDQAIQAANEDRGLLDGAEDGLCQHLSRKEHMKLPEALAAAKTTARNDPATWQKGKDRAAFILGYIRDKLPKSAQNKIRRSIADIVNFTSPNQIGDISSAIPLEIRELLDRMVEDKPVVDSPT